MLPIGFLLPMKKPQHCLILFLSHFRIVGIPQLPEILLKKAEILTKKINIPSIADTIRDNIAHFYAMLYHKQNDKRYLNQAIQITKTIDDDNIRLQRFVQLGHSETFEGTLQYDQNKNSF